MADLANPVRRVRCISIEQVKNCLEAWLMVRSALRSAYYGFVPGDRAARGLPGSCPPTCWTPTDPELFCCQVVNLAGLSHCEYAGMVPAGRHIEGTAKPPARWAKCSSAVFISGEPGEALLWGRRGWDEEPTSTRNLPSTKRRGRVPATPELVCEMPPCECPRFGIDCHYFRCSLQALSSSTQGPLKPTERSGAIEALLFYAALSLSVGNPPTTGSCGRWPVKRDQ